MEQLTTVLEESGYRCEEHGEQLVAAYFRDHGTARLVEHQIDSFNYFVEVSGPRVIASQSIHCKSEDIKGDQGLVGGRRCSYIEAKLQFSDPLFVPPKHREANGSEHWLFPNEARIRYLNYMSNVSALLNISLVRHNDQAGVVERHESSIRLNIMQLPVMTQSCLCNLVQQPNVNPHDVHECIHDPGGSFIIKGLEKQLNPNERPKENGPCILAVPEVQSKYAWKLEIRCLAENGLSAPKLKELYIVRRRSVKGHPIRAFVSKLDPHATIPIFALFYAMGAQNDEEIFGYVLRLDDPTHPENNLFLPYMLASHDEIQCNRLNLRADYAGDTMQEKACRYLATLTKYKPEKDQRNEQVIERRRLWYSQQMVNDDFFANAPRNPTARMYTLGMYLRKFLAVACGLTAPDNRDSYTNKRIDTPGVTINNMLRSLMTVAMKRLQKNVNRELRAARKADTPLCNILVPDKMRNKLWSEDAITRPFKRAFATGDFSTTPNATNKVGLAQQTQRTSHMALLSQARKINTPLDKNGEMVQPRRLHMTATGFACPGDTPESSGLGLVKNMALTTVITVSTWSEPVLQLVRPWLAHTTLQPIPSAYADANVKVLLNGAWIGVVAGVNEVQELVSMLRHHKRMGYLNRHLSIVWDVLQKEIRLGTDGGRICRPLLVVRDGRLAITREMLARVHTGELPWEDLFDYHCDAEHGGVLEYLDVEEQTMSMIAIETCKVPADTLWQYEYAEIHPMVFFGFMMNLIPFPEHNPAIRDGYQNSMSKQANGLFASNVEYRMDKSANVCLTSDRPLVTTLLHDVCEMNKTPAGNMVIMALLADDGNNQEDSITANQACFDRGLFNTVVYNTYRSESDKNVVDEQQRVAKPSPETTIQMKAANYDRVNAEGFVPVNEYIEDSDVLLLRINKIPKNRLEGVTAATKTSRRPAMRAEIHKAVTEATARHASAQEIAAITSQIQMKYEYMPTPYLEDHSVVYYGKERAAVDRNYWGRDGEAAEFAKTTIRKIRAPTMGDKFVTQSAQKGSLSAPRHDSMMPYFLDNGSRPDILMNPHCIPSRMTGALLDEGLYSTLLTYLGYFGNGTFGAKLDMPRITRLLRKLGLHPTGERWMCDGRTGRIFRTMTFSGKIFYYRLRHMVIDKEHCRDEGQMVKLTRQPSEGRAREGGFKMGEMEVGNMLAHGACGFLHDRLYTASDAFQIYVCRMCGIPAVGNSGEEPDMPIAVPARFYCRMCGPSGQFVRVRLPFCFWLALQEFEVNNLCTQFIFADQNTRPKLLPAADVATITPSEVSGKRKRTAESMNKKKRKTTTE